jgi:hypothetical protein
MPCPRGVCCVLYFAANNDPHLYFNLTALAFIKDNEEILNCTDPHATASVV